MPDERRLRRVLGIPAWAWLRQRLRRQLEAGRALPQRVVLRDPDPEERRAANALFATPGRSGPITVRIDELAAILREADLADDLPQALVCCDGPLRDRPAERLDDVRLWQRLSAGDADQAAAWTAALERGAGLLARDTPWHLQELAASLTGDAHALDRGRPLGRLLLLGQFGADDDPALVADPFTWRERWARLGVATPQTTAPVLCLNLRWRSGPYIDGWHAHAAAGEPLRLTLRQLATAQPASQPTIFVCENPCVLEAAANRLGPAAAPLVCVDGQPASAVLRLLHELAAAGAELRYHGDFDWPGLAIGNALSARMPMRPWRFRTEDLLAHAAARGPFLSGDPVAASWDVGLAVALAERGRALHEELLLEELLADLGR